MTGMMTEAERTTPYRSFFKWPCSMSQSFRMRSICLVKERPSSVTDFFNDSEISGGKEFRNLVLKTLEIPPPKGQSRWDVPSVSRYLGVSDDAVWRILRKEGICLARQRSWCVSTDPEFASKAADIVGLYTWLLQKMPW